MLKRSSSYAMPKLSIRPQLKGCANPRGNIKQITISCSWQANIRLHFCIPRTSRSCEKAFTYHLKARLVFSLCVREFVGYLSLLVFAFSEKHVG